MAFLLKLKADATMAARPPALPRRERPPFVPDETSASTEASPPENVGRNRSILVVDDSAVVLKAFEMKLKASGFSVSTTSHAAAVASSAEAAQAALIILDINFPSGSGPDWSGFTVMQWLRRFPELVNIPVILISSDDTDKHKEKALAEGAVAFFQKPVNFRELLAAILHTLDLQK